MKKFFILIAAGMISLGAATLRADDSATPTTETSLRQQMDELAKSMDGMLTPEMKATIDAGFAQIRAQGLETSALKTGAKMPAFTLPNAAGEKVSSKKLLKTGPLVVVFYRGGWCPFCNLQLRDLQKHLTEIEAQGATLVAISPQLPDGSAETAKKDALTFRVLSDVGNKTAGKFGLVFKFSDDLKKLYQNFGIDLEKSNGTPEWALPMAATYVVSKKGLITWSSLDADYKKRPEVAEIIAALKATPR